MPALEARLDKFAEVNTQPVGVSVDSHFCHGAFGQAVGGISFPLLADFNPKGALAKSMGLFIDGGGITDRATVLVDAGGVVRYAHSVTPAGKRDMDELLGICKDANDKYDGTTEAAAKAPGLSDGSVLYVKEPCTFSRWALAARDNLHLDKLTVKNVTKDEAARKELETTGGKHQAPALLVDGKIQYESADIIGYLAGRVAPL